DSTLANAVSGPLKSDESRSASPLIMRGKASSAVFAMECPFAHFALPELRATLRARADPRCHQGYSSNGRVGARTRAAGRGSPDQSAAANQCEVCFGS